MLYLKIGQMRFMKSSLFLKSKDCYSSYGTNGQISVRILCPLRNNINAMLRIKLLYFAWFHILNNLNSIIPFWWSDIFKNSLLHV